MKKLILTALMIPFFVQADRPDVCLHVKETATLIMAARQSGMGAEHAVKSVGEGAEEEQEYRAYMHIIIAAYEIPIYATEMFRENIIREFANKYYISCWKGTV
jgi:hypothetical protein